jgi:hypothetical protein
MAEDADRIARIARRLAALPEDEIENDPEFLALSDEDRKAVTRFAAQATAQALQTAEADSEMAESFDSAADADLLEVLAEPLACTARLERQHHVTRPERRVAATAPF